MTYLYFNIDRYEIYYLFVVQVFWFLILIKKMDLSYALEWFFFFLRKISEEIFFWRADELFGSRLLGFSYTLNRVVHYLLYIYLNFNIFLLYRIHFFGGFFFAYDISAYFFLLKIKKNIPKRVTFNTTLLKCFNAFISMNIFPNCLMNNVKEERVNRKGKQK